MEIGHKKSFFFYKIHFKVNSLKLVSLKACVRVCVVCMNITRRK